MSISNNKDYTTVYTAHSLGLQSRLVYLVSSQSTEDIRFISVLMILLTNHTTNKIKGDHRPRHKRFFMVYICTVPMYSFSYTLQCRAFYVTDAKIYCKACGYSAPSSTRSRKIRVCGKNSIFKCTLIQGYTIYCIPLR